MNEHPDHHHELDEDLATAAALISAAGQVALACHVAPDGDALGSMLALHHVLRGAGHNSLIREADFVARILDGYLMAR